MKTGSATTMQILVGLLLSASLASHAQAIEQAVNWVGGGGNNLWSNPNNWNPSQAAPCNFGIVEFLVTIPPNAGTIVFDGAMGSCEIKSLTLGDNSTLQVAAGTSLAVTDVAEICGIVNGIGGNFLATSSPFTAAEFSCDRARIAAHEGAEVAIDASVYQSTGLWIGTNGTHTFNLMTVEGTDSMLDLSSLQVLDAGFSASNNPGHTSVTNIHRVNVSGGGVLLLPGVSEVVAPSRLHEQLQIRVNDPESVIDLSGLSTISTASRGSTVFNIEDGATLFLPSLENVKHARFQVSGGSMVQDGAGPWMYDSVNMWAGTNGTHTFNLMTVEGTDSMLDLSSLQVLDAGFSASNNPGHTSVTNIHRVNALDGGTMDLSSVQWIGAPVRPHERLEFIIAGDHSAIALHQLATGSTASSGTVEFRIQNVDPKGGAPAMLQFVGNAAGPGRSAITLEDPDTLLRVDGSVALNHEIDIRAPGGGTMSVGGRFCFMHAAETDLELGSATLHFNGQGDHNSPQLVEVGGFDLDLLCAFSNDNFGVGRLVIGSPGQPTVVHLRDDFDNGNTGGGNPEAFYIYLEDGLRIHAGSTLVINDLNVYLCAEQLRIKDLFPRGVTLIEYDEGFIELGQHCIAGDLNCDGAIDVFDLLLLLSAWGPCPSPGGCIEDFNCDGVIDVFDLLVLLTHWS